KNLGAAGDGGAILTSDPAIAEHVRRLQQYGWVSKYHVGVPHGRNSRMDEVQAAVLDVFLRDLGDRNERRRAILGRYKSAARRRLRFVEGGDGAVAHLA
ncbi:MAG: erythromycin biosynthesis sensory transduction protein eryC1, partial [Mesorhizobium sp.]